MASTDKYCTDCKFCVRGSDPVFSKCSAPDARRVGGLQFVAAELDVPPYCSTMRIGACGADAKWFEPSTETVAA